MALSRAPNAKVAASRLKAAKKRRAVKKNAAKVEANFRKKGGYGKAVVSCYDVPEGGIKKSAAWAKLVSRCEGGKVPAAKERDGAPLKGGFDLNKYPPNVIVDNARASWLPDDFAQVLKNTGPGGVYHGWVGPSGKFFYHRAHYPSSIEETLGRKLSALDGINGLKRSVERRISKERDEAFLRQSLTPEERRHIRPAKDFHFAVVSARRATSDEGQHVCMVVEGQLKARGVSATWYVDAASLKDYQALGLHAKVGGKLTPARNMALNDAARAVKVCVQVSDDISRWEYYDVAKQNFRGVTNFKVINKAVRGSRRIDVSPLAAAQFILAKMRGAPPLSEGPEEMRAQRPRLGGVFPTLNSAMSLGQEEYARSHFILGDFFVAEPGSPVRFDEQMTLKEDYDYTCSHIQAHGSVMRCNRLFAHARHATNKGGAVAVRDSAGKKEQENIKILKKKWPGRVFDNGNRQNEVILRWNPSKDGKGKAGKPAKKQKGVKGAKKLLLKRRPVSGFNPKKKLVFSGDSSVKSEYILRRAEKLSGKTVEEAMGSLYKTPAGEKRYGLADLRYDVERGILKVR